MVQANSMMVAPPGRLWTPCWIASTMATPTMCCTIAEWPTSIATSGSNLLATEYTFFWFAQMLGIWSWMPQWLDLELDFRWLSHKKYRASWMKLLEHLELFVKLSNQTQKLDWWLVLMDFDFACRSFEGVPLGISPCLHRSQSQTCQHGGSPASRRLRTSSWALCINAGQVLSLASTCIFLRMMPWYQGPSRRTMLRFLGQEARLLTTVSKQDSVFDCTFEQC